MAALVDRIRVALLEYTRGGPGLVAAAAKLTLSRRWREPGEFKPGEVEEWVKELVARGHGSPLEHSSYTLLAEGCSRVCTHQLVRHRLASYSQQSMRYSEGLVRDAALAASEREGLGCPQRPKDALGGRRAAYSCYARALARAAEAAEAGEAWAVEAARRAFVFPPRLPDVAGYARLLLQAASAYYALLARGASREDARFLLPQSVRSMIVFTMNARELLESFLPLRMCTRAQWEVRRVAWLAWRELHRVHPEIFKWAGPRCVLQENRSRPDPRPLEDYLEGRASFTIARCPETVPRPGIPACLRAAAETLNVKATITTPKPR